jgi:acyl-coenzyme A thioesterase PaaI-like protein
MAEAAVTGEITVRFLKPVETGTRVRAVGRVEQSTGRILHTRGWIFDSSGATAAEGTAKFLKVERPE